jgi:hypothetical protein
MPKTRIAIACQGGGSQTAFTAGALKGLFDARIEEAFEMGRDLPQAPGLYPTDSRRPQMHFTPARPGTSSRNVHFVAAGAGAAHLAM